MKKNVLTFFAKMYSFIGTYKKSTAAVLLLIVGAVYYSMAKSPVSSTTYQYSTVKRGSLTSIVSATGQVTPNSQVELKPKVNANVTAVYVKAGDRVKTGQVLFRLDSTDAYKQVRDAKTSLQQAEISLEKLKNPKSIDLMSVNNSIKQEEDSKATNDQKVEQALTTLLNTGLQAVPEVSYTTETAPTISGSYKKEIEGQIKIAVYQGGSSGYSFSYSGIVSGTGDINTSTAQPIGDSGLYIKWSVGSPQTNWIINIPNKQSTSYFSNYTNWQNAITNRDIANAASDRTITSLKQKLADLTPDDSNLDVQSAILQVTQRKNALLDAEQNLANYTITAPFDGTMASVAGSIGTSAVVASSNSSTALGTIVTDQKLAQITLNESDVVKVKLGQKAVVTFDAIDNLSVEGDVVEINTLGTVTSGVVTYKVKVAFSANDTRILPNMSLSVDIVTDSKDNALHVPNQAVKKDSAGYYVEINSGAVITGTSSRRFSNASSTSFGQQNSFASSSSLRDGSASSTWKGRTSSSTRRRASSSNALSQTPSSGAVTIVKVPVSIGIQTDTQTEIIDGLREGQEVVIKKTASVAASSAAPSITSLFRPQGQTRTVTGAGAGRAQ